MRGKVKGLIFSVDTHRITPAHAGKRATPLYPVMDNWDHPRTCGEKFVLLLLQSCISGSPPHMRGKVIVPHWRFLVNRITPAHAGKRLFILYHHYILWDHPRTCGEKVERHVRQQLKKGSPPHMRGKVKKHPFFPACQQDHPRTCREKERVSRCACWTEGSPPHMRGKGGFPRLAVLHARITPAHAGKRPLCGILSVQREDHPRTCGEKVRDPQPGSHAQGSPPHMRGKAVPPWGEVLHQGITPAHAGKRCHRSVPRAIA